MPPRTLFSGLRQPAPLRVHCDIAHSSAQLTFDADVTGRKLVFSGTVLLASPERLCLKRGRG